MYVCTKCGVQVIVTKGGKGTLKCDGEEMQIKNRDHWRVCMRYTSHGIS
jgi:hypothetical protein